MARKPFICGNWKMNTGIEEGIQLAEKISQTIIPSSVEAVIAPPFTHLYPVGKVINNSSLVLSAQNMSQDDFGAHTGEVAGEMLKELGVEYVILGHSERRAGGESNQAVSEKIRKALDLDLLPIVCVGEEESIKEAGKTEEFVLGQVDQALKGLSQEEVKKLIIAYEPIWAIGTGKTASAEDAQEMAKSIRQKIESLYPSVSEDIRILYGGSAKAANAASILEKEDVDGLLIGGASLKADEFITMIQIGADND